MHSTQLEIDPEQRHKPHEYVAHRPTPRSRTRPTRMDPVRVLFNRNWLALGTVGGAASLAGIWRYGWPALAGLSGVGLAALGHMIFAEPARPVLEHVTLHFPNLPAGLDGLRIGQISDIHLGMLHTSANLRWAVRQMQQEQPDLIVLTGDQVMKRDAIPALVPLLQPLHASLGIYAIAGNHDHWEGLSDIRAALSITGIPLLVNEHRHLHWRGSDFWLIGVDDIWDGELDFARALADVPNDGFKLLLGHAPDMADLAATHQINLQLAGHVHGGHLQLPGLGAFLRPRYGVRYLQGMYQVGGMTLYVSRGLGGAPLRLFCPPEATILTLRRT